MTANTFTERDAILFEIQELKEQARRDYDLYLESRNHRNARYTHLQDRLREIDEIERGNQRPEIVPTVHPVKDCTQKQISMHQNRPQQHEFTQKDADLSLNLEQMKKRDNLKHYVEEKKKISNSYKTSNKRIPQEKVVQKIAEYLRFHDEPQKVKDIHQYLQNQLNRSWKNFSEIVKQAEEADRKIIKVSRGYYTYEKGESID